MKWLYTGIQKFKSIKKKLYSFSLTGFGTFITSISLIKLSLWILEYKKHKTIKAYYHVTDLSIPATAM